MNMNINRESLKICQMKVSLKNAQPPIWRRFEVPATLTLDRLHDVIQIVMGWQDYHLHRFRIGDRCFTEYFGDDLERMEHEEDELGVRLIDVIPEEGGKFEYRYDFGDCWDHEIKVEEIKHRAPDERYRMIGILSRLECLEGEGACPPEDVGGIAGYKWFLEAISDPDDPEHERYLKWCGGSFDPDLFDPNAVNLELAKYARWSRPRENCKYE